MDVTKLCRPLELACIQYAIAHAEFIGYPEGAQLYRNMLYRYMLCKHPARK